jgi:phosphoribosylanthranilate isomerase
MAGIIQIAGVIDQAEAEILAASGVDWLGFPFRLALHREDLPEAEAARIIRALKPPQEAVLITYLDRTDAIVALCRELGVRKVQLHGPVALSELSAVRALDPGLFVMKSLIVHPGGERELEADVAAYRPHVDVFLTDTYDPATGATGATGKTHDWAVSRRLVEIAGRPVILAGGLNPGNVARAIREVRPAGVDAHTGSRGRTAARTPSSCATSSARRERRSVLSRRYEARMDRTLVTVYRHLDLSFRAPCPSTPISTSTRNTPGPRAGMRTSRTWPSGRALRG